MSSKKQTLMERWSQLTMGVLVLLFFLLTLFYNDLVNAMTTYTTLEEETNILPVETWEIHEI